MRKRKWVLFAFIVLIAIGMSFFQAWRLLQANEKLKNIILSEISPVLGDSTHIERVKVGYGNIHIMGIDFFLPHNKARVQIADLRIGYNFLNYLANGFDAAQLSQDVMAVHPRITYYLPNHKNTSHSPDSSAVKRGDNHILQRLSDINRISIKQGEFFCVYADSQQVKLIHHIDGGLFKTRNDSLLLQIRGQFHSSSQENVWVHGHYNLADLAFENISASLNYYDLQDLPFLPADKIQLEKGAVNAQFHFSPSLQKGFDVTGKAMFTDLNGQLMQDKAAFENVQAIVSFSSDSLTVQECQGVLNNADFSAKASLFHFKNPSFSAELKTDNLPLSKFSHLFGSKVKNKLYGAVKLIANLNGSQDDGLQLQGRVYSNRVKYQDLIARSVSTAFYYDNNKLSMPQIKAKVYGNDLSANLNFDFNKKQPEIVGQVTAMGDVRELLPKQSLPNIQAVETRLEAEISGELADPVILGNFEEFTVSSQQDTFFVPAAFSFHNKHVRIISTQASKDFKVNAHVNFNSKPWPINVELQNIGPAIAFLNILPSNQFLTHDFVINTRIDGVVDKYKIKSAVDWQREPDTLQRILLLETDLFQDENSWNARGQFVLHPEQDYEKQGGFSFKSTADYWQLSDFKLDDNFTANLLYDHKHGNQLSGSINAVNLVIDELLYVEKKPLAGSFSTDLNISGNAEHPMVQGDLLFEQFSYKAIGPYNIYVKADYDSSGLDLQRFTLGTEKNTLLFAEGQYNQSENLMDFSIKGAGFDLCEIMDLTADSVQCSGQTLVDIAIHGKPIDPKIVGIVAVKDGKIGNNIFDRFELLLADVTDDSLETVPGLHITHASLSNKQHWAVTAKGFIPFHYNDSLNVSLTGTGNFFYLLSENVGFFQHTASDGVLSALLSGTLEKPYWNDAELDVKNIDIHFRNTIPMVSNASANFTFQQDENFVKINHFNGEMGGKPFEISNDLANQIYCDKDIQNIMLSGLNLGVVQIQTPKKGVPLNFAGLMEPKKFATLDLHGLNSNESFYFGGYGEDKFTIRGQIDLYDGAIMYPFYQRKTPAKPAIRKFLRNLEWDLLVIPRKNVRYSKTFPGAIDEVYVDLQLDEETGALEFSGQLEDESFRINGQLRSNTGFVEYLNMNFRVETVGVEFDRGGLTPVAYGRAYTTYTDSLGLSSKIYLTLQTVDNTMNKKQVDESARVEQERARFDQIRFKLSSDNPNLGTTEAQILAMLGYSTSNLQEGALQAIGQGTDNIIFRPLLRPIERKLEESLRLDYVRFSSPLTKNLLLNNLQNNYALNSRLDLLKSTKIVVGKYFANSVFLQYTGQIESGFDYAYKGDNLGWHHTFGLEYRINPQLLVELQYDYDSLLRYDRDDKRIVLRHWFPF